MDLVKLKNQLQIAVPQELYQIEPNRIYNFIPREGVSIASGYNLMHQLDSLQLFYLNKVKLNFYPTDNEALLDKLAIRIPQGVGAPDRVVIGDFDSIPEFAREAFDGEVFNGKFWDACVVESGRGKTPIVIDIDPKDCPLDEMCSNCPFLDSNYGDSPVEVLQAKPEPGSKEEKRLIKKEENKLYSLLRECYVLDIDLDIDKIKKKLDTAINSGIDYQLIIKGGFHQDGKRIICDFCDIFVADDKKHKLKLTAIEKAVYLTFLLYPQGIRVKETFWGFRETCIKIYGRLPAEELCEKEEGIRNDQNAIPEVFESTLRGYISTIRTEVAKKVANPKTAIEFAIEGYKNQEFGIARSTPEIRAQIKEYFGV